MNLRRLHSLADKTLKALANGKFKEPIKYEINTLDDSVTLSEDFFKTIGINQQELPFVITLLEQGGLIKTFDVNGATRNYDHSLRKEKIHAIRQVQIEDAGIIFIKSTSFAFERRKERVLKWFPLSISLAAFALSIYSIYLDTKKEKPPTTDPTLTKKLEDLNGRIDSLVLKFPKTSIQVDILSDTSSQKKD